MDNSLHCEWDENDMKGADGFDQSYWDKNYAEPKEMDGIGNAKNHANYLKSYFELEGVEINSVIDLGFGLGHLSAAVIRKFKPWRFHGLEPSEPAYKKGGARISKLPYSKLKLDCTDLLTWAKKQPTDARYFDLGICTSVFQYLTDQEIKVSLPIMARMFRYLYLTVPTDIELNKQIEDLNFYDDLAIRRSRTEYLKLLAPHFTLVSSRIWESKNHFNEDNTELSDLLYRI